MSAPSTKSEEALQTYGPVNWSLPVRCEEANARAGGRRHYNAVRQLRAALRRSQVLTQLVADGFAYGSQRHAARALGVSPATISRDVRALRAWWRASGGIIWPADLRTPRGAARVIERMVGDAELSKLSNT